MRYLIRKDKHRSGIRLKLHFGDRTIHQRRVRFTGSCRYNFDYPDNEDVNKLFGLSFGHHHKNSIRIGWNTSGEYIKLFAYYYNNGKRYIKDIGVVEIEQDYIVCIQTNYGNNDFIITVDEYDRKRDLLYVRKLQYKYPKLKWGYFLFPYFGGNRKAPKNMAIYMD